jgi:predicted molibdopterin-dependent oxidoreductase YjgC
MFRRLPDPASASIRFTFDGRELVGRPGDTVALALLGAGILACRTTPISGAPRAPFCLMGICFDCLVTIDGVPNRQACLAPLAEGMCIETQEGARVVQAEGRSVA